MAISTTDLVVLYDTTATRYDAPVIRVSLQIGETANTSSLTIEYVEPDEGGGVGGVIVSRTFTNYLDSALSGITTLRASMLAAAQDELETLNPSATFSTD